MSVAQAGTPREKFFVPSIGSSTQPRPLVRHLTAALLAQHGVARPLGADHGTQRVLGGGVGVGDRGAVGLAGDAQVGGAEPVDGDRVGGVGEPQREREIVGVVGGDRVGCAVGGRHVLHGASLPSRAGRRVTTVE